jgi:hypothetical protein
MRSWFSTVVQQLAGIALLLGLIAGIIGPSDVGWNVEGIALGFWLSSAYVWAVA